MSDSIQLECFRNVSLVTHGFVVRKINREPGSKPVMTECIIVQNVKSVTSAPCVKCRFSDGIKETCPHEDTVICHINSDPGSLNRHSLLSLRAATGQTMSSCVGKYIRRLRRLEVSCDL